MRYSALAFSLATCAFVVPAHAETRDIMVVMDVSGSMWGQIDGVTKIEIARDVFADVSRDWDASHIAAGLIAYGHRRKGDCSDIELLAPVAPGSTAQLGPLINRLSPRGKTPLSDAVRLAAQEMKFTEEAATVILLTDGVETCNADPCALGAELENLGVDFTTHVIGFDIADAADKAQLQCLAAATGGRYLDSGDAGALGAALRQVAAAPDPAPIGTHPIRIHLKYADGTVRPQTVRFQARAPESGEIRDLGSLTGTAEMITGLATTLTEGKWIIEAISDEGRGTVEITHRADQDIDVPFAALPPEVTIQDGSPYQLGVAQNIYVTASGLQEGAEIPITLYDQAGARIDWEYRFGSDGTGVTVHDFESPQAPGRYRIVVGDPAAPLAERLVIYTAQAAPEWRGARQAAPGGTLPIHMSGNTYYYNTLTLSQGGAEITSQILGREGAPLKLPDQAGIYDLSYRYTDADGTPQSADLGQITLGDGGASALPDDPDSVAPPPGAAQMTQDADGARRVGAAARAASAAASAAVATDAAAKAAPGTDTAGQSAVVGAGNADPDTLQALDADAHGWVPTSPAATADPALLRESANEDVVFRCHAEQCRYDDPATGLTGLPVLGDFVVLRPEIGRDGRPFVELVNEMNGEWVVLNPIRQSDMVTECTGFGPEGWHGRSGAADTDMACTVRGANGYSIAQMEALAMWASDRNAAALTSDRAAHDATMGEDSPGVAPGALQGNWQVTDSQSGTPLMRWQIQQDQGAKAAYVDLAGLPGTAFADIAASASDSPSLSIISQEADGRPSAFQVQKATAARQLIGMFTRPPGWDGAQDAYRGMLQITGAGQPQMATITLTRDPGTGAANQARPSAAGDGATTADAAMDATGALLGALSGGADSMLSDNANDILDTFGQIEGMDQLLSGEGGMAEMIDMLANPETMDKLIELGDRVEQRDQP